jgi:hypothetical protein
MPGRIVTTHYRYKRPPGKRKPVTLEVPEPVKTADPTKARTSARAAPKAPPPANDDGPPEPAPRTAARTKPAIVTARRPGKRYVDVPDMPPEELQRRADAAKALWRELARRATGRDRT